MTPNNLQQFTCSMSPTAGGRWKYVILGCLKTISVVLLRFKCKQFADCVCALTGSRSRREDSAAGAWSWWRRSQSKWRKGRGTLMICVYFPIFHTHATFVAASRGEMLKLRTTNFLTLRLKLKGSVKEPNISIYFFFSAHHSVMFYFRCSVYWWKGSVRF